MNRELAIVIGVVTAFAMILSGIAFSATVAISTYQCDAIGDGLNVESQWKPFVGCRIRDGDRWIPFDQYRLLLDSEHARDAE